MGLDHYLRYIAHIILMIGQGVTESALYLESPCIMYIYILLLNLL